MPTTVAIRSPAASSSPAIRLAQRWRGLAGDGELVASAPGRGKFSATGRRNGHGLMGLSVAVLL
uniref:Uncharacterized protein n=1 Tax=Leersia perrieri TaxID=77586 RepID=A0A0D9VI42_9ORYZ